MRPPLVSLAALLLACAWGCAGAAQLRSANNRAVHALIVGIDDYINVQRKLQGSVGDAKDIDSILSGEGVTDIHLLIDLAATRRAFVDEMQRLLTVSNLGDLVIITYSGHGTTVPEYPNSRASNPATRPRSS